MLGGALILAMGNARPEAARWTALVVALLTFVASLALLTGVDMANPRMQFIEQHAWVPAYKIGSGDITWHEDNWDNPDSRFLAWTLHDSKEGGAGDVYIAFNAHGFQV